MISGKRVLATSQPVVFPKGCPARTSGNYAGSRSLPGAEAGFASKYQDRLTASSDEEAITARGFGKRHCIPTACILA